MHMQILLHVLKFLHMLINRPGVAGAVLETAFTAFPKDLYGF